MTVQPSTGEQSVSECFPVGSIARCVTCHDEELEGEVMAFDHITKLLILKTALPGESAKKHPKSKVQIVNLDLVQRADVVRETSVDPPSLNAIHFEKINRRSNEEATRKRRSVTTSQVSPEAKSLYTFISKTMPDEVSWEQEMILVKCVTISAPYKMENVQLKKSHGHSDKQAESTLQHIRKIVERHLVDSSKKQDSSSPSSVIQSPS